MEKSGDLAARVEREIAASSTTSPTPPGRNEQRPEETLRPKNDPALIEAINQVFALFRLNFHNQYYAAFSEAEQLRQIKKLWLESLRGFPPAQILQGARRAIETGEYLPTLHRMRSCCEESLPELGLPPMHEAYLEACCAGAPPEAREWSHPVVYWTGRDCGWRLLATAPEPQSWPVFRERYQARCRAILEGHGPEPVPAPAANQLPARPLDRGQALDTIARLRAENDL